MTDVTTHYADAIAALGADGHVAGADLARRLATGAAALVWARDGTLLWRSAAAADFARAILGESGRADRSTPAGARLRSLCANGAAFPGTRLERLRIGRLVAPTTLACHWIALPSGPGLLTLVRDGPWAAPTEARTGPASDLPPSAATPNAAIPVPVRSAESASSVTGPIRFVWATGEDGRFTSASESLARLVGQACADIVGRHWSEFADDPTGAIAAGFGGDRAWRLAPALWHRGPDAVPLPVSLSGVPACDAEGRFAGFRGFGTGYPADLPCPEPDIVAAEPEPAVAETASDDAVDPASSREAPVCDTTVPEVVAPPFRRRSRSSRMQTRPNPMRPCRRIPPWMTRCSDPSRRSRTRCTSRRPRTSTFPRPRPVLGRHPFP